MATFTADTRVVGGASALARALAAAARPRLLAATEEMAERAKDNIVAEVEARYNTGREGARRRGGEKLNNRAVYQSEVTLEGDTEIRCRFTVGGGETFRVKFFSLNNGAAPHRIQPRFAPVLAWPEPEANTAPNRFSLGVNHPGTPGAHFYERGIERAIDAFNV